MYITKLKNNSTINTYLKHLPLVKNCLSAKKYNQLRINNKLKDNFNVEREYKTLRNI